MNKQNTKQGGAGYPAYNPSSNQKNKKISNISDPYKSQSRSLVARDRNNGTGDNKAGINSLDTNHRSTGSNAATANHVQGSLKNIRGTGGPSSLPEGATSHTPQQSAFNHHDLSFPNQQR